SKRCAVWQNVVTPSQLTQVVKLIFGGKVYVACAQSFAVSVFCVGSGFGGANARAKLDKH
ncbi:MAG: hypothetical protein M3X11_11390, partial [Acidobacteriota bacterium]|nr:hypothetical protein [Acidobacteriota bacterium]